MRKKKPQIPPRFPTGALVRVKPGTTDPDFSDIPLGGWAGIIREVDQSSDPPLCLIEWNQYTLDQMHPVYRNRCQRDGLEMKSMWLGEDEIELDTGEPVVIEQPTAIRSRPLNLKDQDDRVRMAFGLTSDDPLPEADEDKLLAYHRYLKAHLSFPFEAKWEPESGPRVTVKITCLCDSDDETWADEMYGLLCKGKADGKMIQVPLSECEAKKGSANRQLVKDYSYWFWNNG